MGWSFYHATPLLRIFRSERQRADWLKRLGTPDYAPYLQAPLTPEALPAGLYAPHGAGLQQQTGYLDTPASSMPAVAGCASRMLCTRVCSTGPSCACRDRRRAGASGRCNM
jgi:hypothetical protein